MPDKLIIHIDGYMFDLTNFCESHPGGKKILIKYKDKDATQAFNEIKGHCDAYCLGLLDTFCVGKIK